MITWLLYLLPASIITFICYLTNPFIALFADDEGELPACLRLWQTWDDSLDSEYYMKNCVPSCLDYGYDDHYFSITDSDRFTRQYGLTRQFSIVHPDAVWTKKQLLQRYCCRVLWMTRNCAYGFMLYWFGADMRQAVYKIYEKNKFYCRNSKYFAYKNEQKIFSWLVWKIYIGWKTYPGKENDQRCMYAYRFLVKVVL